MGKLHEFLFGPPKVEDQIRIIGADREDDASDYARGYFPDTDTSSGLSITHPGFPACEHCPAVGLTVGRNGAFLYEKVYGIDLSVVDNAPNVKTQNIVSEQIRIARSALQETYGALTGQHYLFDPRTIFNQFQGTLHVCCVPKGRQKTVELWVDVKASEAEVVFNPVHEIDLRNPDNQLRIPIADLYVPICDNFPCAARRTGEASKSDLADRINFHNAFDLKQ
jgi:hypothetical protein